MSADPESAASALRASVAFVSAFSLRGQPVRSENTIECCATAGVLSSCVAVPSLVGIHDPTSSEEELDRDLAKMIAAVDLPAFPFLKKTAKGKGIAAGNVLTGVENNLKQPARDP